MPLRVRFYFEKKSINTPCFILPLNEFFKLHKIEVLYHRDQILTITLFMETFKQNTDRIN